MDGRGVNKLAEVMKNLFVIDIDILSCSEHKSHKIEIDCFILSIIYCKNQIIFSFNLNLLRTKDTPYDFHVPIKERIRLET